MKISNLNMNAGCGSETDSNADFSDTPTDTDDWMIDASVLDDLMINVNSLDDLLKINFSDMPILSFSEEKEHDDI